MDAAVNRIDHHPSAVGDLVDHAHADHLADQGRLARATLEQRHGGGGAVDAQLPEHPLHGPELVGAVGEPAQLALQLAVELPHALLALLGEAQPLQRLQAAGPQGLLHGVLLLGRGDDEDALLGARQQRPVEPGQALLPGLVEELLRPFEVRLGAQLQRDQALRTCAHRVGDVVACHDQVPPLVVPAADDDMSVRVPRVEMVHRHPVQPGLEVALHLREQVADERLEVGEPGAVLGRDDEAELMRVLPGTVEEGGPSHDYKRHGTTTLFAAFEVATGKVTAKHSKQRRRKEFLQFMDDVVAAYPRKRLEVILDNLNTHKKNEAWLARHPRVTFHYTPTRASWLNQVEGWFSILQGQSLTGATFTSIDQLKAHIDAFIETYNDDAEPFAWTKSKVYQRRVKGRRLSEL
jgi:DDE superfamily endonuclease